MTQAQYREAERLVTDLLQTVDLLITRRAPAADLVDPIVQLIIAQAMFQKLLEQISDTRY